LLLSYKFSIREISVIKIDDNQFWESFSLFEKKQKEKPERMGVLSGSKKDGEKRLLSVSGNLSSICLICFG